MMDKRVVFEAWYCEASDEAANMPTSEASSSSSSSSSPHRWSSSDADLGFGERAISAAGAAVLSAILVNPLDVAKTRLQAQAAGVLYDLSQQHAIRCYPSCNPSGIHGSGSVCSPDCFQYRGTVDVFYKVIRQLDFTLTSMSSLFSH